MKLARIAGNSAGGPPMGIGVTMDQRFRAVRWDQSRLSPTRPESSCAIIHFAMSLAPALMPPAGLVLSLANGAMTRTLPSTGAWVAATLPPLPAAEWCTLLPVMPSGVRIRRVTKSSQLMPAHCLDDLARDEVEHVVVGVRAPEAGRQRDVAEPLGDFLPIVGRRRPPEQVAGAEAEPAPVHQQVAHGELAGDVRIGEREGGQVAHHRRVPLDLAFLHQHAERGGGERLGVGRDAEQRFGIHRRGITQFPDAVAFREHHLAVLARWRRRCRGPRRWS